MSSVSGVVFDTSTLVGAALQIGPIPERALDRALDFCDVFISSEILSELDEVLERSKFDRYLSIEFRREFAAKIRKRLQLFRVSPADLEAAGGVCRDPKDVHVLALALSCGADVIVSSDQDLLILHPWRGISILCPSEFLA